MKTTTKAAAALFIAGLMNFNVNGQDIDLTQGLNYAYDPVNSDGIISIDYIDVCNNGNDDADAFDVTVYLYDETAEEAYFLESTRLSNGLSGNACISIEDWDINVNNFPDVPEGTYRFGFWVDSEEEITETNEDNNAGLLDGTNNYTPSTTSVSELNTQNEVSVYPNPATDVVYIHPDDRANLGANVALFDMSGRKVSVHRTEDSYTGGRMNIDVSSLKTGVYLIRFTIKEEWVTKKITIQ